MSCQKPQKSDTLARIDYHYLESKSTAALLSLYSRALRKSLSLTFYAHCILRILRSRNNNETR
ncbi:hypothetical protein [Dipodfec virus UOA04_Rod_1021]|nr:hypothetical protein [Dipodfec virus UOA04_Rod_1021]